MDRQIEGRDTGDYLWDAKQVVPFLKVDKGLADEADGAQVMKPIAGLDELLARASAKGVFGTKMRSVIKLADAAGVDAVVDQQFEIGRQIVAAGLVPIIEPEVDIHSPQKAEAEALLKAAILAQLDALGDDQLVMLKLTLPGGRRLLPASSSTTRTSCGSSPCPAATAATRPTPAWPATPASSPASPGPSPRASRAQQSDDEFDAALDASIRRIYEASIA